MDEMRLKALLDTECQKRDSLTELSYDRPDPLLVASRYRDERIALIAALFAYGNAGQIVKFLDSLDFSLIDKSDEEIENSLRDKYYRFQKSEDVTALFIALKRLYGSGETVESIIYKGYRESQDIRDGLWCLIDRLKELYPHSSQGYDFLIGKARSNAPFKRYMMYFRWMVRSDNLDMGLWHSIDKKDLIIPLDTHTHKVSLKLRLINRKSYDMKSALLLTEKLKEFDPDDPVKYDFALYRIGQEGLTDDFSKESLS